MVPWLSDLLGLVLGSGRLPVMPVGLGSPLCLAQVVQCSDSVEAELGPECKVSLTQQPEVGPEQGENRAGMLQLGWAD